MDQKIQIKFSDEDIKGRYSNAAQITHTKEEFILDFMNLFAPAGILVSRVVVSPGHAKRLLNVLTQQVKTYETTFGPLEQSEEPRNIGFKLD